MVRKRSIARMLLLGLAGTLCLGAMIGCSSSDSTTSSGPATPPSGDLPIMYEFYTDW